MEDGAGHRGPPTRKTIIAVQPQVFASFLASLRAILAFRFPSRVSDHRACHFPSGSPDLLPLPRRSGKIALRSHLDLDSGPWLRIRLLLRVLTLRSRRPPLLTVAAPVGSLCFVFPADSAFPHSAPPAPARTGRRGASVPARGSQCRDSLCAPAQLQWRLAIGAFPGFWLLFWENSAGRGRRNSSLLLAVL